MSCRLATASSLLSPLTSGSVLARSPLQHCDGNGGAALRLEAHHVAQSNRFCIKQRLRRTDGVAGLRVSGFRQSSRRLTLSVRAADVKRTSTAPDFSQSPGYPQVFTEADPVDIYKRDSAILKLENTAAYFRRLGTLGFWGQLICSVVSAVVLAFSIVISGSATSPVTLYLTSGGIVAAFLSVFWSFDYTRLSNRLREAAIRKTPNKAPTKASIVANLRSGLIINLLGLGATLLGLQATVGVLVAKALTSSYPSFVQGMPPGYSPVMALDVFLVQASGNTLLSHFLGLVLTLELLRGITHQPPPGKGIPRPV